MSAPRVYPIKLFLDDESQFISVAIYKDTPIAELRKLIAAIFPIPHKPEVVGVYQQDNEVEHPMIPLSYIAHNPRTIDAEAKYQIITTQGLFHPQPSFWELVTTQCRRLYPTALLVAAVLFVLFPFTIFTIPDFVLLHRPVLRNIYLNGPHYKIPHIADFGFWNGKELKVICSELSGQSSEFWSKNAAECYQLYSNKENAFIILTETVTALYLIYTAFKLFIKCISFHLFS